MRAFGVRVSIDDQIVDEDVFADRVIIDSNDRLTFSVDTGETRPAWTKRPEVTEQVPVYETVAIFLPGTWLYFKEVEQGDGTS